MNPKKRKLYKKMIGAGPDVSDIKKEIKGASYINIKWTFVDSRKTYKVSAYKVSFNKYDSYVVNVFRKNKCVTFFAGPGKARKLIERIIAIQEKSR